MRESACLVTQRPHCAHAQIKPDEFWAAAPDPVARFAGPVCSHMNKDHAESIVAMVRHYAGISVEIARMLGLDRLGVDCEAVRAGETFRVRLPFEPPAEDRKSVKDRIVAMTRAAKQTE